jgi:hypothetical protein
MGEWQPIEIAPKDESWILVYDRETNGQYVACWIGGDICDFVPHGWDCYGHAITATHWMPLPAPPNELVE